MTAARHWTDARRVLAQLFVLGCCCLVTLAVRAAVDAGTLSDPIELSLNSAALVVSLASVFVSFAVVRATRVPLLRAGETVMSLLVVCLAGAFVHHAYADVSIELADLVEPAQAAEGVTQIVVGPTGKDVRLSGDIKEGAADILERILTAHPSVERIHLTSDGGLAEEGQALAEVIAAHRLTTYVPDYCVSACTLAFVGGKDRILMDGARLGFHAPYQEGLLGQTFAGDAEEQRAAYIAAGLAADFVEEALKVSPDDIWIPERDRLLAAHVATAYVDRYRFPDSILDGVADHRGARDAVLRNFSMLASIDAASPQVVDRMADWYLQAYRRGASEGGATDGLKRIVGATIALVLVRADDATLLDLARFVQAAIDVEPQPGDCALIGETVDLVRAAAAVSSDKDADARAQNLVGRALDAGRAGAPVFVLASVASQQHHESCAALRQVYADALQRRDPAPLRRRLQAEAPKAARLLASVVAQTH